MGLFDLFSKKKNLFVEKDIIIDIDGLGIAFYSPKTVSYIKKDYDFLNNEFMKPEDIANHIMKCDISAFCTGSPGKFILKIRKGNPSNEKYNEYDIVTRLGINVKDNRINFVDLFWLSSWDTDVSSEQTIELDNGYYYITAMTKIPESKKYGDNQIIYLYFDKVNSKPKLKYYGAPILFKDKVFSINKDEYDNMSDEDFLMNIIYIMEKSIVDGEIDISIMDECIKIIKERNVGSKAIEPFIKLMERNELVSFGQPGSIVHYLESLDNYEDYLIDSIKRNPTLHTIWMLNRLINKHDENEKVYLELMKNVSNKDNINVRIKNFSKELVEFQEENN